MTHASVFSGIGDPEVAAAMLGWENVFHCEINEFGRAVLGYWFPNAKSYDDITKTDFSPWRGRVDVLTGGFPCQPFSYAGQRRGAQDDRYLWPHMHRAINEIKPRWIVAENVAGITTMVEQGEVSPVAGEATLFAETDDLRRRYKLRETFTLERICRDIEADGYEVYPVLIPACAVGAPHRRDRVFIVGRRRDAAVPEDPMHVRRGERPNGEQGSERNERHAGAGDSQRLCGETSRAASADALLCGSVSPRTSEAGQGAGIEELPQQDGQGEGHAPSGHPRLSGLSRHVADPDGDRGCEVDEHMESELADGEKPVSNGGQRNVADPDHTRLEGRDEPRSAEAWQRLHLRRYIAVHGDERGEEREYQVGDRWLNFPSVSPIHRGNDGLPFDVDRLTLSFGKWRTEALKAYGNAIVPQVMYEIYL